MVHLLHRLYGVDAPGREYAYLFTTKLALVHNRCRDVDTGVDGDRSSPKNMEQSVESEILLNLENVQKRAKH